MYTIRVDNSFDTSLLLYTVEFVPPKLLASIGVYWYLMEQPLYRGLLVNEAKSSDGRAWSQMGGWFAETSYSGFLHGHFPHIYLDEASSWAAVHEFGHAVDAHFGRPSKALFRPGRSMTDYGKTNALEYFACCFDAYFGGDHEGNSRTSLANADLDIYKFFERIAYA